MFCIEGGLYVFELFDGYSGNIQLLFCLMCELAFIPFLFGLDKLNILMKIKTKEEMPKFVYIFIKYVIPIFIFIVYVIAWIYEFQYQSGRDDAGWTPGILWAGRLLWIVPLLIIPFGMWKPLPAHKGIDELVREQYGIEFDKSEACGYKQVMGAKQADNVADNA